MHPLGAVVLPGQRGVERVAVAGLGAGRALHQAYGLAVGDIHGGQQFEGHDISKESDSDKDSAAAEDDGDQGRQDEDGQDDEDDP